MQVKLAEFIERKVEGGSAFVDAQDELDKQLKDAGMDSKGRIGYTNSRGRFIKKGDRNAEQEALFKKFKKRKELRKLRDDMRNEMDAQKQQFKCLVQELVVEIKEENILQKKIMKRKMK